ncbi:MAG: hypothetical protein MAG715_00003 [Methanonatronarchaeales archaeon]|nr:hypothetical protein [Methanonatronarchaeales archaeon]
MATREKVFKARELVEEGEFDYQRALDMEDEFKPRKVSSQACENVFHAMVETVDVVLARRGKPVPDSHLKRMEALQEIGRSDLVDIYAFAKETLHDEGYYEQRLSPLQESAIDRVKAVIEKELGLE